MHKLKLGITMHADNEFTRKKHCGSMNQLIEASTQNITNVGPFCTHSGQVILRVANSMLLLCDAIARGRHRALQQFLHFVHGLFPAQDFPSIYIATSALRVSPEGNLRIWLKPKIIVSACQTRLAILSLM